MDRDTRIAVIGAGLAGLTVAALLQRDGFKVEVFEQAPSFSRIGAGIILGANVAKVFRKLGIEKGIVETGIKPSAFISRAWDTGETLFELAFDAACEDRFGGPFINIHRADLHALLAGALAPRSIRFDHALAGIDDQKDGVRLRFTNGAEADADIVIGADGIRSKVRDVLFGMEEPRFTGHIAQRAVFPAARIQGLAIPDCTKWWGPDRHVLAYYMTARRDEVYAMGSVPGTWGSDQQTAPGSRDGFIAAFESFHFDLRRVIEAATDVIMMPIHDRPRNDRWSDGSVVLMGDACHAVRPYMAAGGAMAIEDAAVLARCLARFESPTDAFRFYEATRIPRVADIQRISVENSWMRNSADTAWFFGYEPTTVELAAA